MMSVVLVLVKPLNLNDQFICFFEMLKSVSELTKERGLRGLRIKGTED